MDIIKQIKNVFEQAWKSLSPPRPFSWQTFIALSVFSWVMSLLTGSEFVKDAVSTLGWLFLTIGVGWALTDHPIKVFDISLGPWITGALACTGLFGTWTEGDSSLPYVSWPIISAILAGIPKFLKPGPVFTTPKPSARQDLVLLILVNLVFSCWFQFHFLIQDWLEGYPSLLIDDFGKSAFVTKLSSQTMEVSRGSALLDLAEPLVEEELENLSWAETESWLADVDQRIAAIKPEAIARLSDLTENAVWDLQAQVLSANPGYDLRLQAVWQGPSSVPAGYYVEKACLITRVPDPSGSPEDTQASNQVTCQPVGPPIFGQPNTPSGSEQQPTV